MKNRKIYLSGPMTGYPEMNYPLFNAVSERLRDSGHEVYNPAEYPCEDVTKFPLGEALTEYVRVICNWADTIVTLPGWQESTGALMEWQAAKNMKLAWFASSTRMDVPITADVLSFRQYEMGHNLKAPSTVMVYPRIPQLLHYV